MKVVINSDCGGYGLSAEAYKELGIPWDGYGFAYDDDRTNPKLVAVVEKLGAKADGFCAKLKVVEIPDGIKWEIDEDDGMERVDEVHESWS